MIQDLQDAFPVHLGKILCILSSLLLALGGLSFCVGFQVLD